MHIPPKDLWQNADMFHKQVQEARNQEALAKLLSKEGLELNPDSRPGSEDGRSDNRPHSKKKTKKRATTSKSGTKSIIASVATIDLMQPTVNSN